MNFENRIAKNDYIPVDSTINEITDTVKIKSSSRIYPVMDINFLTMESLILAQDERWRRASYMQVEREADFGQWKVADG